MPSGDLRFFEKRRASVRASFASAPKSALSTALRTKAGGTASDGQRTWEPADNSPKDVTRPCLPQREQELDGEVLEAGDGVHVGPGHRARGQERRVGAALRMTLAACAFWSPGTASVQILKPL